MAEQGEEQDKSEDATPFKLDRARRKGQVARGMDLGFVSSLIALAITAQLSGMDLLRELAAQASRKFSNLAQAASGSPDQIGAMIASDVRSLGMILLVPALIVVVIVVVMEVIQIRGIVFTAAPLKPDFNRLNPAKVSGPH